MIGDANHLGADLLTQLLESEGFLDQGIPEAKRVLAIHLERAEKGIELFQITVDAFNLSNEMDHSEIHTPEEKVGIGPVPSSKNVAIKWWKPGRGAASWMVFKRFHSKTIMNWVTISSPKGRGFNFHRKLWHMGGLAVPILLYLDAFGAMDPGNLLVTRQIMLRVILGLNIALLAVEILRMNHAGFRDFFHRMFGFLMKDQERTRFHGTVAYMAAALMLFLFFTDEVIILSLLFLVIADPVAAFVGIHAGRIRFWNGKTLEGMIAFLFAACFAGLAFLALHTALGRATYPFSFRSPGSMVALVVGSGTVSAIVEFLSFTALRGLIDDNITVPLAAALAFLVLGAMLGFPADAILFPGYELL